MLVEYRQLFKNKCQYSNISCDYKKQCKLKHLAETSPHFQFKKIICIMTKVLMHLFQNFNFSFTLGHCRKLYWNSDINTVSYHQRPQSSSSKWGCVPGPQGLAWPVSQGSTQPRPFIRGSRRLNALPVVRGSGQDHCFSFCSGGTVGACAHAHNTDYHPLPTENTFYHQKSGKDMISE